MAAVNPLKKATQTNKTNDKSKNTHQRKDEANSNTNANNTAASATATASSTITASTTQSQQAIVARSVEGFLIDFRRMVQKLTFRKETEELEVYALLANLLQLLEEMTEIKGPMGYISAQVRNSLIHGDPKDIDPSAKLNPNDPDNKVFKYKTMILQLLSLLGNGPQSINLETLILPEAFLELAIYPRTFAENEKPDYSRLTVNKAARLIRSFDKTQNEQEQTETENGEKTKEERLKIPKPKTSDCEDRFNHYYTIHSRISTAKSRSNNLNNVDVFDAALGYLESIMSSYGQYAVDDINYHGALRNRKYREIIERGRAFRHNQIHIPAQFFNWVVDTTPASTASSNAASATAITARPNNTRHAQTSNSKHNKSNKSATTSNAWSSVATPKTPPKTPPKGAAKTLSNATAITIAASAVLTDSSNAKESDEDCTICEGFEQHPRLLLPCKHSLCEGCIKNIEKVREDKGEKYNCACPFCRAAFYYTDELPEDPAYASHNNTVKSLWAEIAKLEAELENARKVTERLVEQAKDEELQKIEKLTIEGTRIQSELDTARTENRQTKRTINRLERELNANKTELEDRRQKNDTLAATLKEQADSLPSKTADTAGNNAVANSQPPSSAAASAEHNNKPKKKKKKKKPANASRNNTPPLTAASAAVMESPASTAAATGTGILPPPMDITVPTEKPAANNEAEENSKAAFEQKLKQILSGSMEGTSAKDLALLDVVTANHANMIYSRQNINNKLMPAAARANQPPLFFSNMHQALPKPPFLSGVEVAAPAANANAANTTTAALNTTAVNAKAEKPAAAKPTQPQKPHTKKNRRK